MTEHTQTSAKIFRTIACIFAISLFLLNHLEISFADELEISAEETIEKSNASENALIEDSEQQIEAATVAPNLDLKEVAPLPEPMVAPPKEENEVLEASSIEIEATYAIEKNIEESVVVTPESEPPKRKKLIILGAEVPIGTSTRLAWSPPVTITGLALPTPVLVINGANPGPTLCLTGAIHGDELNGIEVVRRVMYDIKPEKLNGTLIGVPIVNLQGFQRGSRYLSDRRDLNRFFPGEPNGSLASRIAYSLFTEVISHCNYLIDLHTGSLRRTNIPQIRADMTKPQVIKFVEGFDKIAIVHHRGNPGMLRTEANANGVITITMELGESLRIQENQVAAGTHSVNSLLDKLEMYPRMLIWGDPKPAYYESTWLRVESGGILFSEMGLGDSVEIGDRLGVVTDPITNQSTVLESHVEGNIIGMAINQVVIPGFAAYHIGIESTQENLGKINKELDQLDVLIDGETIEPE